MGKYVVTVDAGTTNTRVFLWNKYRMMVASAESETGVRNTAIDGNNDLLKKTIHDCIEAVLEQSRITYEDVDKVIACGMITSNVGLVEIPHVYAPTGLNELAEQAKEILLKDICPLPILFIPGVKNNIRKVNLDNFEEMDVMRGEEVETMAILNDFPKRFPYMLVLPGSHTKFVAVNKEGQITGCLTTITGELLASITNDTIIADAVGKQFVNEESYDREMMLKGFDISKYSGIGRACFSARILNMFSIKDKEKLANYILGVCLATDVQAVKNSKALCVDPEMTVIVSGKNPLRKAIVDIMQHDGYFKKVQEYIPNSMFPLSAIGAYLVADRMK